MDPVRMTQRSSHRPDRVPPPPRPVKHENRRGAGLKRTTVCRYDITLHPAVNTRKQIQPPRPHRPGERRSPCCLVTLLTSSPWPRLRECPVCRFLLSPRLVPCFAARYLASRTAASKHRQGRRAGRRGRERGEERRDGDQIPHSLPHKIGRDLIDSRATDPERHTPSTALLAALPPWGKVSGGGRPTPPASGRNADVEAPRGHRFTQWQYQAVRHAPLSPRLDSRGV